MFCWVRQSLIDDTGAIVSEVDGELAPFQSSLHGTMIDIKSWKHSPRYPKDSTFGTKTFPSVVPI